MELLRETRDRCYDVMKHFGEKLAFGAQTKGNFEEKVIITLVFKKNANFSAEIWQKSQKIVIITSVPLSFATVTNLCYYRTFRRKKLQQNRRYF
jgi:hypothetical protein